MFSGVSVYLSMGGGGTSWLGPVQSGPGGGSGYILTGSCPTRSWRREWVDWVLPNQVLGDWVGTSWLGPAKPGPGGREWVHPDLVLPNQVLGRSGYILTWSCQTRSWGREWVHPDLVLPNQVLGEGVSTSWLGSAQPGPVWGDTQATHTRPDLAGGGMPRWS